MIMEKPATIAEYESGRAIPANAMIAKVRNF
jgi:ribosome-binding protein aMBF1 (putative translation factor)